jgi:CHAD domain-containing protein
LTLPSPANIKKTTGLRYWMERVLEECDRVSAEFKADPVHDLRVALRRCRSLADGLGAIDPDPDWKAMKKAGRRLFQRLGDLRDVQVMMEWIEQLHPAPVRAQPVDSSEPASRKGEDAGVKEGREQETRDPVAAALWQILTKREGEHKQQARLALEEFDSKQWRQWSKSLPLRGARIRRGSAVFQHLALERWTHARELHAVAMRNRSQVALHTLRIGIKRFRYIVENFLPEQHQAWGRSLKEMQDLLGEVHDLDVLWATALSCRVFPDAESRTRWRARLLEERAQRITAYRGKMLGSDSLWQVWRAGLPQGKKIRAIATQRMKFWAKALDPDFRHSEHVTQLALQLYDSLVTAGMLKPANGSGARESLSVAALLHDVGRSKGNNGHHKHSFELIREHGTPLGWNPAEMQRAAAVARFHRGALPARSHKILRDLLPDEQKMTIDLAAVLRLANALDAGHDGQIRRIQIENGRDRRGAGSSRGHGFLRKSEDGPGKGEALILGLEGFNGGSSMARTIAAERYLLETVLRRPVVVKPMKGLPVRPAWPTRI